jgi:hypothetical protein
LTYCEFADVRDLASKRPVSSNVSRIAQMRKTRPGYGWSISLYISAFFLENRSILIEDERYLGHSIDKSHGSSFPPGKLEKK